MIYNPIVAQPSPIDIDDINLQTHACPPPIDCDFNEDMCGWTRDLNQHWIWDHGIGRVEDAKALPKYLFNPTTHIAIAPSDRMAPDQGMFMYTDFTGKSDFAPEKMILTSPYVPGTLASCLSFYYLPLSFNNTKDVLLIALVDTEGNFSLNSKRLARLN